MANLNPTFRKELQGKKIKIEFDESFKLTPYELNQIRFWLKLKNDKRYNLPAILPVSKRFSLDFIAWNNEDFVLLIKFRKHLFTWN